MSEAQMRKPAIMECTIRDGSYNVKFKFTDRDTRRVTAELSRLGFQWIEIGHGLGLGAMRAGKGDMPADDEAMIVAARESRGDAKIGAFFIPGIGTKDDLLLAKQSGLDFIRVGYDAENIEAAYPYIEYARSVGLFTFSNVMKSYSLTPEAFAENARSAVSAGAQAVYCVDSAGGMFPQELARYFQATKALVDCPMGFHGHNNLMMAIPNCLAAYENGAEFLDTTLCGLGRSSGNAPSEILVAAFARLGIDTGVDVFDLMDVIDQFMWPLVSRERPHDMMAVTAGYSRFHSSFLAKVSKAAEKYDCDQRRLVAKMAFHDEVHLDEQFLEQSAKELSGTVLSSMPGSLAAFQANGISAERISNSFDSVRALIRGLSVSQAKRPGIHAALHLVPSKEPSIDLLLAEFVLEDHSLILGRVTYGSIDMLTRIASEAAGQVAIFMVSREKGWASDAVNIVTQKAGPTSVISVRDDKVRGHFLGEALEEVALESGCGAILIYGYHPIIDDALGESELFDRVFIVGTANPMRSRAVHLGRFDDWQHMSLQFNVIVCTAKPADHELLALRRALAPKGRVLLVRSGQSTRIDDQNIVCLDLDVAFAGVLDRHLKVVAALKTESNS